MSMVSADLLKECGAWADAHADEVMAAVEANNYTGFCIACDEEAASVEPDATGYKCGACGERKVFGAEVLLLTLT